MAKYAYIEKNVRAKKLNLISDSLDIIQEYDEMGYTLTLRQLYYQLVARDIIPNSEQSYKNLGVAVKDGRELGMIDWDAIEDRTRNLESLSHWDGPAEILSAVAEQYRRNLWENQPFYVEVVVEKQALEGVIGRICDHLDVPYMAAKGYISTSEMHAAAMRYVNALEDGRTPVIIHLGDHDPSGIDMTRDIIDRAELYIGYHISNELVVERIALNYDQIEEYNPPPNPAKESDSRAAVYVAQFGHSSWELDALNPDTLDGLITSAVLQFRDNDIYQENRSIR